MILNDTENNGLNEKKTDIRTLIYVIFQIEIVFQRKKKKKGVYSLKFILNKALHNYNKIMSFPCCLFFPFLTVLSLKRK